MNEPIKNQNQKWIALSVLMLLVLSGGVYRFVKHRGAPTPAQEPVTSNSAGTTGTVVGGADVKKAGDTASGETPTTASVPGVALPGAPGGAVTTALAPAPGALAPTEPAAPQDQCVTVTYHHKATPNHGDEESCSHHKNMLKIAKLGDTHIATGSVCVRVNGTPVHYLTVKGHADELIFGSVAGPKAKVTIHYCTGKGQGCAKEDCTVPKDEFMEAIGGAEGASQNAKLGQWDPDAPVDKEADVMAKLDGEVKKELESNDDLNGRAPAGELFKDWIGETQSAACGTTQAKN